MMKKERVLGAIHHKTPDRVTKGETFIDGNLCCELQKIALCGFDGLQSIQPSAGMDIAKIKREYGDRWCLWGNIDLDYIMCFATPSEVKKAVRRAIAAAGDGGGFILSTCNSMVEAIPPANVFAMMEAAQEVLV